MIISTKDSIWWLEWEREGNWAQKKFYKLKKKSSKHTIGLTCSPTAVYFDTNFVQIVFIIFANFFLSIKRACSNHPLQRRKKTACSLYNQIVCVGYPGRHQTHLHPYRPLCFWKRISFAGNFFHLIPFFEHFISMLWMPSTCVESYFRPLHILQHLLNYIN